MATFYPDQSGTYGGAVTVGEPTFVPANQNNHTQVQPSHPVPVQGQRLSAPYGGPALVVAAAQPAAVIVHEEVIHSHNDYNQYPVGVYQPTRKHGCCTASVDQCAIVWYTLTFGIAFILLLVGILLAILLPDSSALSESITTAGLAAIFIVVAVLLVVIGICICACQCGWDPSCGGCCCCCC